jgi:hypothetical protein
MLVAFIAPAIRGQFMFSRDTTGKKRRFIFAVPVIYYTPETRFAFGASGLAYFNFKNDSLNAPRSVVSLGFVYTQNDQVIFQLPFTLFIRNRAYQLYGELGYNKYFYNFYGRGNSTPSDFVEKYSITFPRLRFTALKRLSKYFFAGPRIVYDHFSLEGLDPQGQLLSGDIPGSAGGTICGPGAVFMFDSRNLVYYPSRGIWSELVIYRNDKAFGGSFNYTRVSLDFSKYFSYRKNIFALNFYSVFSDAELPFFNMAFIGGQKKMRGFYEGRYRDNNLLMFQAEYRRELFWRFGMTLFADAGQVAQSPEKFNNKYWRYTYGGGLRFRIDDTQKLNVRMDLAVGNNKVLAYLTVAEAF